MTKMRQWTLLTALAVVAILVAGWMLLVKPQHTHANTIQAQADSMQQQNSVLANQLASLRAQSKDLPAQQAKLASIATKIPDSPALPAMIRALTAAASNAGVDLVSIAPGTPTAATGTAHSATTPTTSTAAKSAATPPPLSQIQLTLNVKGTYFTIEQFFSDLEGLPRALRVTGFSLSGTSSGSSTATGPAAGAGGMTANITADVYEAPAPSTTPSHATTTGTK